MTQPERREVSVTIARGFDDVERHLRDRTSWPRWASGLAAGITKSDDDWIVQQEGGPARLRFLSDAPGRHDHVVTLADGQEILVPLRLTPVGNATSVQLTLIRQPSMSDEVFARDADWIRRDLDALKRLVEAD